MDTRSSAICLTLLTSLGFVTALLVLFVLSVLKHYRNRLREHKRQLARELGAIEAERYRIASDLHDEVGLGLSAIILLLENSHVSRHNTALERAAKQLKTQQQRLQEIARGMAPRILETHGLAKALEDLYLETMSCTRLVIRYYSDYDDSAFVLAGTVHLFRIIQELLHNTLKHSGASHFNIIMKDENGQLCISTSDDGKGISLRPGAVHKGHGLHNIRCRVQILGGSFTIQADKNGGTVCRLSIPLSSLKQSDG